MKATPILLAIITAGTLGACMDAQELDVQSEEEAVLGLIWRSCVHVVADVGGQQVITPAVPIYVDDIYAITDAANIHVDPSTQTILGYSVDLDGIDQVIEGQSIILQGIDDEIESFTLTVPLLSGALNACLFFDTLVEAPPVHVPETELTIPGSSLTFPDITFGSGDLAVTVPGAVLSWGERTIVIPEYSAAPPNVVLEGMSDVFLTLDGSSQSATCIAPESSFLGLPL
ncbi:hypothetical protein [Haliangium ochraceum]|uniref:Uncharacterized protein n=1 Tax=Haliangium ochraceum (strain DSM 14365 / JCM 11303 / SMP-2) TaxID=502025 RepID=D0LQG1_HALO1|nr:hypothetical protein [Haliangium ochraceum]ACY18970.1 hypothetical protein Hoch_6501 [Haliangium ochraceum DSM 14365]